MNETQSHQVFFDVGINLANQDVDNSGFGFNYFFPGVGGGIMPVIDDTGIDIENFRKFSKILFDSNFSVGFDTVSTWDLAFEDVLVPEGSDVSAINGNNEIGPADVDRSRLPMQFEPQTYSNNSDAFIAQSKHYPKFNSSQGFFLFFQALFFHDGVTTNTQGMGIKYSSAAGNEDEFDQNQWNIDVMDGSESANNPSGINIDFSKIQTAFIYIPAGSSSDIKLGFLINNEIFFVHEIILNNSEDYSDTPPWGNLNLPIRVSATKSGANPFIYEYGLFNGEAGIRFIYKINTSSDPSIVLNHYLHKVFSYSYGAIYNEKATPFPAGNDENLIPIAAVERPILSVRSLEDFNGNPNTASFSLENLNIYSRDQALNNGCIFRVMYNATIVNSSFNPVNSNSSVEFDVSADSYSGGIEMAKFVILGNTSKIVKFLEGRKLENIVNNFSAKKLKGKSTDVLVLQTITITAKPISGAANINVGSIINWVEKY